MPDTNADSPGYTSGEHFPRVGQGDHVVRQGECMASIAEVYGFFWETLWNHPDNAELKQVREDPNILMPGDRVAIPERRSRVESVALDARHRLRRKGVPEKLRLQFCDDLGEPRAELAYELDIGGNKLTGTTDQDGFLEIWIMPAVKRASLRFFDEHGHVLEEHQLDIGHLPPIDSGEGIAARLCNLGFLAPGQPIALGIEEFQRSEALDPSGVFDDATRSRLRERAGS